MDSAPVKGRPLREPASGLHRLRRCSLTARRPLRVPHELDAESLDCWSHKTLEGPAAISCSIHSGSRPQNQSQKKVVGYMVKPDTKIRKNTSADTCP